MILVTCFYSHLSRDLDNEPHNEIIHNLSIYSQIHYGPAYYCVMCILAMHSIEINLVRLSTLILIRFDIV